VSVQEINDLFIIIFVHHIEDTIQIIALVSMLFVSMKLSIKGIENSKYCDCDEEIRHNREHTSLGLSFGVCAFFLCWGNIGHIYVSEVANLLPEQRRQAIDFFSLTTKILEGLMFFCISWGLYHVLEEEHEKGQWFDKIYPSRRIKKQRKDDGK